MTRTLSTLAKVPIVPVLAVLLLGRAGVGTWDERPIVNSSPHATAAAGAMVCGDRPPADLDGNCTSTLADFAQFAPCLTGPAAGGSKLCPAEDFEISDVDGSGHVDLYDFARIQNEFGQTGGFALPDDWGGTWQITLTARDCGTKEIVAVDEYGDLVCPGQVLAEGLIKLFNDCPAALDGDTLTADCRRAFTVESCEVRLMLALDVMRSGDTLSGEVQWWGELTGLCDLVADAPCEVVTVEGQRTSTDVASCGAEQGVQR